MPRFCLEFSDRDHQSLKLAAVFSESTSLKEWATRTLLAAAQQTVSSRITELPPDGVLPQRGVVILPPGTTATPIINPPTDPEQGKGGGA